MHTLKLQQFAAFEARWISSR